MHNFKRVCDSNIYFIIYFITKSNTFNCSVLIVESMIRVDLIQDSDLYSDGRLLAWHDSTAQQFLYPYPTYLPAYGRHDRELLLDRSVLFPVSAIVFEIICNIYFVLMYYLLLNHIRVLIVV